MTGMSPRTLSLTPFEVVDIYATNPLSFRAAGDYDRRPHPGRRGASRLLLVSE